MDALLAIPLVVTDTDTLARFQVAIARMERIRERGLMTVEDARVMGDLGLALQVWASNAEVRALEAHVERMEEQERRQARRRAA